MTAHKCTILVVDDEAAVRKMLCRAFERESYQTFQAANQQQALEILESNTIDLATVDLNLDADDGLELTRAIRSQSRIPIIIISGKSDLIDKVVGLEIGADDYIAKPFELREVLARVKAALRRINLDIQPATATDTITPQQNAPEQYRFANHVLCPISRNLSNANGKTCELTTAEFDLLYTLAGNTNRVMTRDQIMDAIKGADWSPTDRTIDNQIARIRKKLGAIGIENSIKTVRGQGYQFTLPTVVNSTSNNELKTC